MAIPNEIFLSFNLTEFFFELMPKSKVYNAKKLGMTFEFENTQNPGN